MTTEENTLPQEIQEQEPIEVQEPAPTEAVAEDDAFQKGFNAAQGVDEPEPKPEPEPEPILTPEQARELLETVAALKQRDAKVFGTIGSLKQQLDAIKSQPTPQAVKLTADKLKRLSAEFPEMAQMLSEDLSEALQGGTIDPGQVSELVEQTVSSRLEQTSRSYEAKFLSIMHPDWKQVVASPEFEAWKQTLDEEERDQLLNSWDAQFIAEKISAHKDWKNKTVQNKQTNQRRLESAITPKGSSAPPAPSPDDAFIQGFRQVRGIR